MQATDYNLAIEPLEIVMAVDAAYLRQLAVALASLSASTTANCRVHVLHDDLARDDRERVQASLSDSVEVRWVNAAVALRGRAIPERAPFSTFLRLFLPELLPDDLERVLYLDADLIVRRPLVELWAWDLGDAPVAAVRDAYMPWIVRDPRIPWRAVSTAPDSPYFNSGVMLVSLARWRERDVVPRSTALLSQWPALLDQAALNIVFANDWMRLDPVWNVQSYHLTGDACLSLAAEGHERVESAVADPAVVHFTGGSFNRPWQAPCRNPFRDEWLECLDHTAWRGWRPRPTPAAQRALGRLQRALRVLTSGSPDPAPRLANTSADVQWRAL